MFKKDKNFVMKILKKSEMVLEQEEEIVYSTIISYSQWVEVVIKICLCHFLASGGNSIQRDAPTELKFYAIIHLLREGSHKLGLLEKTDWDPRGRPDDPICLQRLITNSLPETGDLG